MSDTAELTKHEKLFDFFSQEHDLVLTNSQIDDVLERVFEVCSDRLLDELNKHQFSKIDGIEQLSENILEKIIRPEIQKLRIYGASTTYNLLHIYWNQLRQKVLPEIDSKIKEVLPKIEDKSFPPGH